MPKGIRDNFPRRVIDDLSKRVALKCSNPNCSRPTSGPSSESGHVNTGVAAHITAASAGGPRYNVNLSTSERCSADNGIWLCQTCSKLIDTDENLYSVQTLRDWKTTAEARAFLEQQGYSVTHVGSYSKLREKIPQLIAEMKLDLQGAPFVREFIAISRQIMYNHSGKKQIFCYYSEDHEELLNKLTVMENYGAIREITFNNTHRYVFEERFVEFLLS